MIPNYVSVVNEVTPPRGRSTWLGNTIFTACIIYTAIVCWHFHTQYTGTIFGSHAVRNKSILSHPSTTSMPRTITKIPLQTCLKTHLYLVLLQNIDITFMVLQITYLLYIVPFNQADNNQTIPNTLYRVIYVHTHCQV